MRGLHLVVLSAFGIAQPLFTEIDGGSVFIAFHSAPWQIILLTLVAVLGPPALLLGLEALAGLWSRRAADWLHFCFVAGLAGLFVSQLVQDRWSPSSEVLSLVVLATGLAFGLLYIRFQPVRSTLTVLAPVPILFAVLFLFFSPVERLAIGSQGDPPAQAVQLRNPVIVVVFDAFQGTALMDRPGHINAARFPNFARLARGSSWFPNATTVHSFTDYAVPAIASGRRSGPDEIPAAHDHPRNLFSLLAGNEVHAREPFEDLCPDSVCPPTGSLRELLGVAARTSLKQWLPPALSDRVEILHDDYDPSAEMARFTASIGQTKEPALHYLHVLLPHIPYVYLPSGRRYASQRNPFGLVSGTFTWGRDAWPVVQAHKAFLLQTMYTDRLLGALIDRLRRTGLYDRSMIVVTADHGVSFHPGLSRREVSSGNFEDIASVPFFVKKPGQREGDTSGAFVRTVDVVPTIVDVLGLRSPWRFQGRSAFARRTDSNPALDVRTVSGVPVRIDARSFVRRRDEAIRAQLARFGTSEQGLYRIGPHSDLMGRAPKHAPVVRGATIALSTPSSFEYDPRARDIPARVVGTVNGPDARDVREIAVALNGRVAVTTRTFMVSGGLRFAAIVPEAYLRPGANSVEVYEIAPGRSLKRLALEAG
jgi:hypothetical protein